MANLTMANLTMMMNEIMKGISMVVNAFVKIGVALGFTPSEVRLFLIIVFGVSAGIRIAHNNAVFARRLRMRKKKINKRMYDSLGDMSKLYRTQNSKGE